jgi:hypothetical protein|tara:strand:+ start:57 stop:464 length:408 start_codon:yes stop_codon:yes gene_type:complete
MSNDNRMWCQNSKCPEKKNQNQIRGTKGHKYYQSNKSASYYFYWCSMNCRDKWWEENKDTCMRAVGLRTEPVKLLMENAWSKDQNWNYPQENTYYLENKLRAIKIPITEQQYNSISWTSDECMALATTLQSKQSA